VIALLKSKNLKALNNIANAEATVAVKLNQTSSPKTGCKSFSGALFGSFWASKKSNKKYYDDKR